MTFQGDQLDAILDQLENHQVSLPAAVRAVRSLKFPVKPARGVYGMLADDANGDPRPPEHGSPFYIAAAYVEGRVSRVQYEALAAAAAQSIREVAGERGEGNSGDVPAPHRVVPSG